MLPTLDMASVNDQKRENSINPKAVMVETMPFKEEVVLVKELPLESSDDKIILDKLARIEERLFNIGEDNTNINFAVNIMNDKTEKQDQQFKEILAQLKKQNNIIIEILLSQEEIMKRLSSQGRVR